MMFVSRKKQQSFEFSATKVTGALLLLVSLAFSSWEKLSVSGAIGAALFAWLVRPRFNLWQLRGDELMALSLSGWRRYKLKGMWICVYASMRWYTVTIEAGGKKLLSVIGERDPLLCAARVSRVFRIPFDEGSLARYPLLNQAIARAEHPEPYRLTWGDCAVVGVALFGVAMILVGKC